MIDLRKLIEAGVHFGHQTWRWCPKMQPYIWGEKNSIHLIDVSKTAAQLERAAVFLESVASQGRPILWIGTKKAAQAVIADIAAQLKNPFVNHRWIGGTLTNFPQVKKSVTKLLHYEDILSKAEEHTYTKKERVHLQKMADRHRKNVGGICNLTWPIGALVVVDVKKEHTAVREAASMGIPVIGIVDTNSDPSVDYPIPANDDITRAISLLTHYLAEAAARGYAVAATRASEDIKSEDKVEAMLKKVLGEEDEERGQRGPQRRSRGSAPQPNRGRRPAGNNRARPQGPRTERPNQEADSPKSNEAEASPE